MSDAIMDIYGNVLQDNTKSRSDETLNIGGLGIVKAELRRIWEAVLRAEGFGVANPDGRIDVDAEIDNLMHYTLLSTFYFNTEYDILNRKRFLAEFSAPVYSNWGLNRSIIPYDSFVKDILSRASLLYKQGAVRSIKDQQTHDSYHQIIKSSKINTKSKSWHKLCKLHDLVLVRPVIHTQNGRSYLTYDIKTPDQFRVILDDNNAIEKVLYPSQRVKDNIREDVIIVWTASQHYGVDVHGNKFAVEGNPNMINPYKVIPFVPLSLSDDSLFYSGGAQELVYSNLLHNFYQLLTNADAHTSSLNVFIGQNLGGALGTDPFLRPGDVLNVESQDSTDASKTVNGQFVSSELFADRLADLQDKVFKRAAIKRGIPPSFLADTVQELSGKALRSSYRALLEEKMDDADVVRDFEVELAVMTCTVSNYHRAETKYPVVDINKVREGFYVDFNETEFAGDDPNAEFTLEMDKVEAGILGIVDVIRKYNPDISNDEEAMAFYDKNKATLAQYQKKGFTFPKSVNGALNG